MSKSNEIQNSNFPSDIFHEVIKLTSPAVTVEHTTGLDIAIPHEFNSLPMICYNKKVKPNESHKYYLNFEQTRYIQIIPSHNNKINSEFEERVLFAILAIAHRQKELLNRSVISNKIITTIPEIVKVLGLKYNGKYKKQITEAIERLSHTRYSFKDCYYNSNKQEFVSISDLSIISSFKYLSSVDIDDLDSVVASLFLDGRIKDFLVITINEAIITNFINKKGYLLYNANKLLSINSGIARKIYMYCDRNRWNSENDLIYSVPIMILKQIIPIMTKSYSDVVKIIENALNELEQSSLIVDYIFNKTTPLQNSLIEISFATSRKYKNDNIVINNKNIDSFKVHSVEVIDVTPKNICYNNSGNTIKKITDKFQEYTLHQDISNLFIDILLQNNTVKLINDLYENKGIIHIKALIQDVLKQANNYDSYIYKMLTNDVNPKWYEINQAKFIKEYSDIQEKQNVTENIKTKKQQLEMQYASYLLEQENLVNLKLKIQDKVKAKIHEKISNPPKLLLVKTNNKNILKIDEYIQNTNRDLNQYLDDKYLFYFWILLNDKGNSECFSENILYSELVKELF